MQGGRDYHVALRLRLLRGVTELYVDKTPVSQNWFSVSRMLCLAVRENGGVFGREGDGVYSLARRQHSLVKVELPWRLFMV